MPDDTLPLASEFPAANRAQWLALVDRVLKGAPFDTLVSKTSDGVPIVPLAARTTDAQVIASRMPGAPWQVIQRIDDPDAKRANAQALHELESGASGLALVFDKSIGAHGYGLDGTAAAIARALDGVHLDAGISIELDLSSQTKDGAQILADLVKGRGFAPSTTDIRVGFDPLGQLAAYGLVPSPWPDIAPVFLTLITDLASRDFRGPFAVADGRIIHNAGGTEAQELAFVLACAVEYLRTLEAGGVPLDIARRLIFFRLSADADQFLTMAKFRALRKLWARVEDASALVPEPIFISAETAWRMMTRRDPHVNMLRTTIAVAAAGLGGANAITALPFTAAIGLPDRVARRIARNIQLILLEESNLARVADPAAGASGIEDLTDKLCAVAWAQFQEIERAGGIWPALEQTLIQTAVAEARTRREAAIAGGQEPLVGTTVFPNPKEIPANVLDAQPRPDTPVPSGMRKIQALTSRRLAEPYE